MSNVVSLLQTLGEDARLHHVIQDDAITELAGLGATDEEREALASGDRNRLELLAGTSRILCCNLEKHDDDDDENDSPPEREDEVRLAAATLHDD